MRPGPSGPSGLLLPPQHSAPRAHTPDAAVLSPTDRSSRAELIHELMAPASLHPCLMNLLALPRPAPLASDQGKDEKAG